MEQKLNSEPQPIDNSSASLAQNPMLSAALSVVDGNVFIAEFDGYVLHPKHYINFEGPVFEKGGKRGMLAKDFEYHKSWDQIIPVINKFINENVWPTESKDRNEYRKYCNKLYNLITDFDIVPVFNCLAKAIEWHRNVVAVGSR